MSIYVSFITTNSEPYWEVITIHTFNIFPMFCQNLISQGEKSSNIFLCFVITGI